MLAVQVPVVTLVGLAGEMAWTSYWDIKWACSRAEDFVKGG